MMAVACAGALATLVPVALHQLGALSHLPDPPGRRFDSDGITESKMAHPLGIPDGLLGMASYSATLALIAISGRCSGARRLLAVKLVADGGAAAFNMLRQGMHFRRLCSWCTGTALATAAMVFAGRTVIGETASLLPACGCVQD
jgi:uncharacterized membrane protein